MGEVESKKLLDVDDEVFASAKRGILGLGSRVPKEGATNSLGVKEKGVEGWGRGDRGEEEPVGSGWRDVEEGEVEARELDGEEFGGDDGAEEGGKGLEEVGVRVRVRERV
ncbi:hypothetical protein GYH30_027481 [Glycine max]|nr:hypothetical protein GYH30_027481 [Glycine max]